LTLISIFNIVYFRFNKDDADTLGVYRAQVQARAVENNVWVVHANAGEKFFA
jgi:hypothetical protein